MESTPYITPADPLPATTSVVQSQVPLVQTAPVVTSQIITTPVVAAPQVSYVPMVSTIQPPQKPAVSTGVKVVPIYDDF